MVLDQFMEVLDQNYSTLAEGKNHSLMSLSSCYVWLEATATVSDTSDYLQWCFIGSSYHNLSSQ